jgi:hypothetical protein
MKYLPTIIAVITAVAGILAPQLQALIAHHPGASTLLLSVYAVLTHLLPSPLQKG